MAVSGERATSFGAVAAAYAQHRPGYPDAAVAWALEPAAGHDLLDLGAGTGKLTEALLTRPGARVTAVDPDPGMLTELRARFPEVDAREGSAELIPLPDASVDAVLVGQAWHWYDPGRALQEIARVLRPGGVLAAVWNQDDIDVEWVAGYHRAAVHERPVRGLSGDGVVPAYPDHGAYFPSGYRTFPNPVRTTAERLIATVATHSWALISDPADRDAALARIRDYLATRPETSAGAFEMPLVTAVLRALRR